VLDLDRVERTMGRRRRGKSQAENQLRLLDLLSAGSMSTDEIATSLQLCLRTARCLVNQARLSGLVVKSESGWKLADHA
jgi:transposase